MIYRNFSKEVQRSTLRGIQIADDGSFVEGYYWALHTDGEWEIVEITENKQYGENQREMGREYVALHLHTEGTYSDLQSFERFIRIPTPL